MWYFPSTFLCNFYPRPPRGGRLSRAARLRARNPISIHALREEGDLEETALNALDKISIHALREEGDSADSFS